MATTFWVKILGSSSSMLLKQFKHNCCAKTVKLCSSMAVRPSTSKMVSSTVKIEMKMQSKSMNSALGSHAIVTMWSKASVCVVARLLHQEQGININTLDFKKQLLGGYIITFMQISGNKGISSTCMQIFSILCWNINSLSRQQVCIMAVYLVGILDQCVIYILKMFGVILNFQVWKLWLLVDSGMLGLMQDQGKLGGVGQVCVEEENELKEKML